MTDRPQIFSSAQTTLTEIFLNRFNLRAHIGVYHKEKGRSQPLILTARVWADVTPVKDDLVETIDYNLFSDSAQALADSKHFDLVETFLNDWAAKIMVHPMIVAGEFMAEKPEAINGAASAGVRIFRQKH